MLSEAQIERYARHVLLREVGGVGQEKILGATVRIEGLGAAAEWAAAYLALAGVGRIELCDSTPVDPVHAGPLLGAAQAGTLRDVALAALLPAWNPDVNVVVVPPVAEPARHASLRCGDSVLLLGAMAFGWDGPGLCRACIESDGPVDPAAAALLGSLASSEVLLRILQGARPEGSRRFDGCLPAGCDHR